MKKLFYIISIAFLLISCSQQENIEVLSAEIKSFIFNAEKDSIQIKVISTAEWTIDKDQDWITCSKIGQDSIIVAVSDNMNEEERSGNVILQSKDLNFNIQISQIGNTFRGRFEDLYTMADPVISKNGRYVAGVEMGHADEWYIPVIIDTYTGERTEMEETMEIRRIRAISNDKKTIVVLGKDFFTNYLLEDGNLIAVPAPENHKNAVISAIADDSSIWVGYAMTLTGGRYVPVKWINGEPEILETPTLNCLGDPLQNGAMARDCSADGSVIYGSEWDKLGLIYWRDGRLYEPALDYTEVVDEYINTILVGSELGRVSNNGKYITAGFKGEPLIINTETSIVKIIETDINATGLTVRDDGLIFGGLGSSPVFGGIVFDPETSTHQYISEWAKSSLGAVINDDRMIQMISGDQNVLWGVKFQMTGLGPSYTNWYMVIDKNK